MLKQRDPAMPAVDLAMQPAARDGSSAGVSVPQPCELEFTSKACTLASGTTEAPPGPARDVVRF
jgi:hypothetical protein